LQPSLFTRLAAAEAELLAMKDMLAELRVNQDELRKDREEWRWRAEYVLAELKRGAFWRWRRRTASALNAIAASLFRLIGDHQNRPTEKSRQ
jgi:hypothetical protein